MTRFYNIGRVLNLNKESNMYKVGSLSNHHQLTYFEYLYWKNIKDYDDYEEYIILLENKLKKLKRKIDFSVREIHQKLVGLKLITDMKEYYLENPIINKLYIKSFFSNFYLENDNYYVTINNKKYKLNYSFVPTMTTHPFTIKELVYIYQGLKKTSLEESYEFVLNELKESLINGLVTIEYFESESLKKEIPDVSFENINLKNVKETNKEAEIFYYIGGASIYKDKVFEKELIYLEGEFKTTSTLEYLLSEGIKSKSIKRDSLMIILANSLNISDKSLDSALDKIIDKGILVPIVNSVDLTKNKSIFLDYAILPKGKIIDNKSIELSTGEHKKLSDKELLIYMNSFPELTVFETALLVQKEKQIPLDELIYEFFDSLNILLSKEIVTLVKIKKN